MSPLVLVTGGTGKTGRRLVARLHAHRVPYRVASRAAPETPQACRFDWGDPRTWPESLEGATAAYLVAPPMGGDAAAVMIDFARAAIARGVSRLVLLSASLLPAGGPGMGRVHAWLQENAPEWAVLRPSWFMQNFSEGQHLATIREEGAIYSAAGRGRVPFIDADDIARCAFAAMTNHSPPNADFILTGDRAISYDDVARIISEAVGRPIQHRDVSVDELAGRHHARGMPEAAATLLAAMDRMIAAGAEDRVTDGVESLARRRPGSFESFAGANASVWAVA